MYIIYYNSIKQQFSMPLIINNISAEDSTITLYDNGSTRRSPKPVISLYTTSMNDVDSNPWHCIISAYCLPELGKIRVMHNNLGNTTTTLTVTTTSYAWLVWWSLSTWKLPINCVKINIIMNQHKVHSLSVPTLAQIAVTP